MIELTGFNHNEGIFEKNNIYLFSKGLHKYSGDDNICEFNIPEDGVYIFQGGGDFIPYDGRYENMIDGYEYFPDGNLNIYAFSLEKGRYVWVSGQLAQDILEETGVEALGEKRTTDFVFTFN